MSELSGSQNPLLAANYLRQAQRPVIKVGSALLVDPETGLLNESWLQCLAIDIARRVQAGQQPVLVSSGAIALGRCLLGLPTGILRLEEKQAAASVGQIHLANAWQSALSQQGLVSAQILLSPLDMEKRCRHLNARNTLQTLLHHKAIPIINENDTVATEDICYGDNDQLAARVTGMVSADLLVLLSDVDGLYSADPRKTPEAHHFSYIPVITDDILKMAEGTGSVYGSGGMATKLMAARICAENGVATLIAKGICPRPLQAILKGGKASLFTASKSPKLVQKHGIAGFVESSGTLYIDTGASKALTIENSLFPAGVHRVEGMFERGDPVAIVDWEGQPLGLGLAGYAALEPEKLLEGKQVKLRVF